MQGCLLNSSHYKIFSDIEQMFHLAPVKGESPMSKTIPYKVEIIRLIESCSDTDLLDLVYKLLLTECCN